MVSISVKIKKSKQNSTYTTNCETIERFEVPSIENKSIRIKTRRIFERNTKKLAFGETTVLLKLTNLRPNDWSALLLEIVTLSKL